MFFLGTPFFSEKDNIKTALSGIYGLVLFHRHTVVTDVSDTRTYVTVVRCRYNHRRFLGVSGVERFTLLALRTAVSSGHTGERPVGGNRTHMHACGDVENCVAMEEVVLLEASDASVCARPRLTFGFSAIKKIN